MPDYPSQISNIGSHLPRTNALIRPRHQPANRHHVAPRRCHRSIIASPTLPALPSSRSSLVCRRTE
jgi:hypothetical protein